MTNAVERVVVVGRDAAAWIAALAIRRAFARAGVTVTVVELPPLLREVDAYAALPSLAGLHKLLGIEEEEILAACAGVPMAAQRFSNWGRSQPAFLHGYDVQAAAPNDLNFLHYWVKASREGLRVAFEDFSLAAAAAKQGKVPTGESRQGMFEAAVGYNLHAPAYAAFLQQRAVAAGVGHRRGRVAALDRESDRIAAVLLEDGERVEGDLFIDASGPEARLIGDMPGASFNSWREWLPCDRILAASGPRLGTLPSFNQISAFRAGWVGLHPLQDRTAVSAAWQASILSEEQVLESLATLAGMPIAGDAVVTPFEAGVRPRPWIGNCIAIGEAAIGLEPLDAVQLHLIHIGVSQLIALFPVETGTFPEAQPFNEAIGALAANLRDFQIAHYRLNRRYDEPFWDAVRDAQRPDSLDARLSLFQARSEILLYDHESFQEQNWAAIFVGHGLVPEGYDRRIDRVPQQEHIARVQQRLRAIAEEVNAMPTVETYLAAGQAAQTLEFF